MVQHIGLEQHQGLSVLGGGSSLSTDTSSRKDLTSQEQGFEHLVNPRGKDRKDIAGLIRRYFTEEYLNSFFSSYQSFVIARDGRERIVFVQAVDMQYMETPFSKKKIPVIQFGATAKDSPKHYSMGAFFYYYNLKLGKIRKYFQPSLVISRQINPNITEYIPQQIFHTYSAFHGNLNSEVCSFIEGYFGSGIERGLYDFEALRDFSISFPEAIKYIPKSKKLLAYYLKNIYSFDKDKIVFNGKHQVTVSLYKPSGLIKKLWQFSRAAI